ncbi:MAG: hypothetical protein GX052_00515 [Syntrophomonadaceae bacterium]|jgi:hypothetical protein|nr:hypothetical protein [Syntrophomonadaceae bacterium]
MLKEINLVFHRRGLRSFIEVDLCADCPRRDHKGCCGHYSPVFYLTDLYFIAKQRPQLIDCIARLPCLTVLDASITVNSLPDEDGSSRCQFHSTEKGCLLPMELRESVCRHFVCPGISWDRESRLAHWKEYFGLLEDYEIDLNNYLAARISQENLSLRRPGDWDPILAVLETVMGQVLAEKEEPGCHLPRRETVQIVRPICFGSEWPL